MIIPYLSFQGNCEEAIALYSAALGGKVEYMSRYTIETGGPALDGKVMHMEMSFGDGAICGADQVEPVAQGGGISLLVHCKPQAKRTNSSMRSAPRVRCSNG